MVIKKAYKKNQLMVGSTGKKAKKTAYDWISTALLILFTILCAYPLVYVLAGSFSEGKDYVNGGIWL